MVGEEDATFHLDFRHVAGHTVAGGINRAHGLVRLLRSVTAPTPHFVCLGAYARILVGIVTREAVQFTAVRPSTATLSQPEHLQLSDLGMPGGEFQSFFGTGVLAEADGARRRVVALSADSEQVIGRQPPQIIQAQVTVFVLDRFDVGSAGTVAGFARYA